MRDNEPIPLFPLVPNMCFLCISMHVLLRRKVGKIIYWTSKEEGFVLSRTRIDVLLSCYGEDDFEEHSNSMLTRAFQ